MAERRKFPRYPVSMQVHGWLLDTYGRAQMFDAETMNVGREGIAILYYDNEEKIEFIQSLLVENWPVGLEMEVPLEGDRITATGRVRWQQVGATDTSLHYLIAGIFLEHMEPRERAEWERFIEETGGSSAGGGCGDTGTMEVSPA